MNAESFLMPSLHILKCLRGEMGFAGPFRSYLHYSVTIPVIRQPATTILMETERCVKVTLIILIQVFYVQIIAIQKGQGQD